MIKGWSHDQFPKMVKKTKVVSLDYSFWNLFELYPKVLLLWRYEVKDLQKHCIFFCEFPVWFAIVVELGGIAIWTAVQGFVLPHVCQARINTTIIPDRLDFGENCKAM